MTVFELPELMLPDATILAALPSRTWPDDSEPCHHAQGTAGVQPQQQRWSIPADGRHLMVQKEPPQCGQRSRPPPPPRTPAAEAGPPAPRTQSSPPSPGNTYYPRWFSSGSRVGKSTLANIFAGVHDSMDSDCGCLEVGGPAPEGFTEQQWSAGRVSGWVICLQSWKCDYAFLATLGASPHRRAGIGLWDKKVKNAYR